jgi:predicted  nucleic acid-binding Zn-ribbon protein
MNLVGKIITILILLLSVCFMVIGVMVNASHQNWKQQAIDNKNEIEALAANRERILGEANVKNEQIKKEKVARMIRIQQLESQLQQAERDFKAANEALNSEKVKAQESFIVVKESESRIKEQDGLIDNLQKQLSLLTESVAEQRGKVTDMTGQIFELNSKKVALENMRSDLVAENAQRTKVMNANGLDKYDLTNHIPRDLKGRITAMDGKNIAINLGLDDGLRRGHSFDIYRGDTYVGTATVFEAQNNRSAARVDSNLTKVPVQVNDQVTTKWILQDASNR